MIKHIWKFCWKKKLKTQSQYFVNIYEAIHKFISFESHLNLRVHSTWNLFIIIKQVHSTGNWIVTRLGFFIFQFLTTPPSPAPPPSPLRMTGIQILKVLSVRIEKQNPKGSFFVGTLEKVVQWVKIFFSFFEEKLDQTLLLESRHP